MARYANWNVFPDVEVAINERMHKIFDQLNQPGKIYSRNNFEYEDESAEDSLN